MENYERRRDDFDQYGRASLQKKKSNRKKVENEKVNTNMCETSVDSGDLCANDTHSTKETKKNFPLGTRLLLK